MLSSFSNFWFVEDQKGKELDRRNRLQLLQEEKWSAEGGGREEIRERWWWWLMMTAGCHREGWRSDCSTVLYCTYIAEESTCVKELDHRTRRGSGRRGVASRYRAFANNRSGGRRTQFYPAHSQCESAAVQRSVRCPLVLFFIFIGRSHFFIFLFSQTTGIIFFSSFIWVLKCSFSFLPYVLKTSRSIDNIPPIPPTLKLKTHRLYFFFVLFSSAFCSYLQWALSSPYKLHTKFQILSLGLEDSNSKIVESHG